MERVALKIQRCRYSRTAVYEVAVHHLIRRESGECPAIIGLREAFLHEGHVCMAFEKHGCSLDEVLADGPLPPARVRRVTRQLLTAIERIHRCGYAHTDIKPDNILYDARTGEARLADLGSADHRFKQGSIFGTREYMAPEIIIGAPLSPSLDLWSLGCTVFEMLAGRRLFRPRRAAAKKYREFSRGADAVEVPLAQSVTADEAVEAAEQFAPGAIVAGKYALENVLGCGRFGTVWVARELSGNPLDGSYATLWGYAGKLPRNPHQNGNEHDDDWRNKRGADDLLDLALNYEHILEITGLRGRLPPAMVQAARYRTACFEDDGDIRFRPHIRRVSLRSLMRRLTKSDPAQVDPVVDFLGKLLTVNPSTRISAAAAIDHPWLKCVTPGQSRTAPRRTGTVTLIKPGAK